LGRGFFLSFSCDFEADWRHKTLVRAQFWQKCHRAYNVISGQSVACLAVLGLNSHETDTVNNDDVHVCKYVQFAHQKKKHISNCTCTMFLFFACFWLFVFMVLFLLEPLDVVPTCT